MGRSTIEVLQSARRVLENALQGETDYVASGERRLSGLYNAVSSGRSVTFVLQNLRSPEDDFDKWYAPRQEAMRADPVAKFFHELRNRIEKEGDHGTSSAKTTVKNLSLIDLMHCAPAGTRATFIGDPLGRSGWTVGLPDGTETTVYFTLPAHIGETIFSLDGAPDSRDLSELLRDWLAGLEGIYLDAVARFAPSHPELASISRPAPTVLGFGPGPLNRSSMQAIQDALRQSGYA